MTPHARLTVVALALALAGGVVITRAGAGGKGFAKPFLPADAYQELVARDSKTLQELLAGKADEEKLQRAQFLAAMIAGYATGAEAGTKEVRGTAVAIGKLTKKDAASAAQLAASLPKGKAGTGPAEPINAKEMLNEPYDLMSFLHLKSKGGEGLPEALMYNARLKTALNGQEDLIRYLAQKPLVAANLNKTAKELELFGYRLAVAGALTHDFTPAKAVGKKDPAVWWEQARVMRDAAVDLAQAAGKKNAQAVFQAAKRLDASCHACHSVFR